MPSYSSYQATVAHYRQADLHRRFHLSPMNLLAPLPDVSLESSPLPPSSYSPPSPYRSSASPPPPAAARPAPPPSSASEDSLGSSLVFSGSSQSAMLYPPSDGPPLLFPGTSSSHKIAAAVGSTGQQQQQAPLMIGPDGDASLEDGTDGMAGGKAASSSGVVSASRPAVATSAVREVPSSTAAAPTSVPAVATSSASLPTTTSPLPRTTTRLQPTTLTLTAVSTSILTQPTSSASVLTSLIISTESLTPSTTLVSTISASSISSSASASSLSTSSSASIPFVSTSLLAGLAHTTSSIMSPSSSSSGSSSLPSSTSTGLASASAANDTSHHSKAPLIIIISLSALVLFATLATSLSWLIRHRHSRESFWSSFCCCCFGGSRRRRRSDASSDVSYEHDDQDDFYEAYGPEAVAGANRRASAESQLRSEKFYGGMMDGESGGMGRSSSLDGGLTGEDGGMERRRSIKRGIAESEMEDGFNLHDAQTLGESQALGRKDSTFLDPANGRHLTPVLPSLGSPLAPSPFSTPRSPFAVPALMTPTPEVVSTLSGDSPYPTSRPLPGKGLVLANYVPGDITDVENASLRSTRPPTLAASGYETDVARGRIGSPRERNVSRPRFLSLGDEGGLEVPWQKTDSPSDTPYGSSSSQGEPLHQSALPSLSVSRPSPFLSQDCVLAPPPPAHISSNYDPNTSSVPPMPSSPFPEDSGNPATDTWAATLRTNLFAAISNITGSGSAPLDPEKGMGGLNEKGDEVADKYTRMASPFSRTSSRRSIGSTTSSIPSRHGVKHKLYHTPSVASSLYSTTTDDDLMTEHNSPMSRPKRSGLRSSDKRKIHALGTPAPSSMGLGGGLRMATEEGSSDDGSAWNGLGGKSDFEV